MLCPLLVCRDPGSVHLVALSSLRVCLWPGGEGREGKTEGGVVGLDVGPLFLSLNWGLGFMLFRSCQGMWFSHVPGRKSKGGLDAYVTVSVVVT